MNRGESQSDGLIFTGWGWRLRGSTEEMKRGKTGRRKEEEEEDGETKDKEDCRQERGRV